MARSSHEMAKLRALIKTYSKLFAPMKYVSAKYIKILGQLLSLKHETPDRLDKIRLQIIRSAQATSIK